jgi:flagellin-like protein
MQLRQILDGSGDERAVTPVIGIVLMVAVAVILAALIAPELLSLSRESGEAGPSSVIKFDYDATATDQDDWGNDDESGTGLLTITHTDGEPIPLDRLTVRGASSGDDLAFSDSTVVSNGVGLDDGQFNSGDEVTVWVNADDTVRIVWDSREGTKTTAVAVWDGA